MNKRKLHYLLKMLHKVHFSFLIVACLGFATVSLFSLRANNQRMVELRTAVFTADKENGDIEGALRELREYVFAHMNTNLSSGSNAVKPPIQLKYHYERLQAAARASYDAASAKMVSEADAICTAQHPGSAVSIARYNCAKAYAAAHLVPQPSIPEYMYKFDFVSPRWTPDLAGWSMVISVLFLILFVTRFVSEAAIKRELR